MVIKTPAIAGVFPKSVYLECEGKMLENYFPVLLFIILGVVIGVVPVVLGWFVAPHRPDAEKNSPYECGFEAFEDARMKFDVRYYLIAILFILFDLEVAFLLPWASILKEIASSNSLRLFGFIEMFVFLAVLVIGYVYVWKKGALDWE
jgi:NADH-quinone oxidoreductase subunit A